jgi:hypothetical protein
MAAIRFMLRKRGWKQYSMIWLKTQLVFTPPGKRAAKKGTAGAVPSDYVLLPH